MTKSEETDGRLRCRWAESDVLMREYHDEEWGVPLYDSRALWEMLMLEGFQAGLSWAIILRKREGFRRAFQGFDPAKIARFRDADVERLMGDAGIVRARAKIEAAVAGARIYVEMEKGGEDFGEYVWGLAGGNPVVGTGKLVAKTGLSEEISKALKERGFKFVGATIVYAWMQAVGMVNDHAEDCFRLDEVKKLMRRTSG